VQHGRTRRQILAAAGGGFGGLALRTLGMPSNPWSARPGPRPARAKSVIFLFMVGGPSQIDTFDYKPLLNKLAGQSLPASFGTPLTAAGEGKSPLLKCKRKSDVKTDEVEDGARAAIIEEAISILVFNQAEERGWYVDRTSIDIGLLKTIRRMCTGLEVRASTAKQWQEAISQGYAAFRELTRNGGGDVTVDLDRQRIAYRDPTASRGRRA
jgi:hypothetical protein